VRFLSVISLIFLVGCSRVPTLDQHIDACANGELRHLIEACTAVIESHDADSRLRSWALINRGIGNEEVGESDLAILDFTKSIQMSDRNPRGYFHRGNSYSSIGKYELAIQDYSEAIAQELEETEALSNLGYAYNNRGFAYEKLGYFEQALRDHDQAIRTIPEHGNAYLGRGNIFWEYGRLAEAAQDFDTAIRFDPDHAVAHNNLAWLLATESSLRDPERAVALGLRAIELEDHYIHRGTLAAAYSAVGRAEDALSQYEVLMSMNEEVVLTVQSWLAEKGYFVGSVDGIYGNDTRAAIEACVKEGCQIGAN